MCTDKKKLGKSKHVTYKSRAHTERTRTANSAVTQSSPKRLYAVELMLLFSL